MREIESTVPPSPAFLSFSSLFLSCSFLLFFPHSLRFSSRFLRTTTGTAIARLSRRNFFCPSVCLSVCLSVCHTGAYVNNGASQDYKIFTVCYLEDLSFRIREDFSTKGVTSN